MYQKVHERANLVGKEHVVRAVVAAFTRQPVDITGVDQRPVKGK